MPNFSYFPLQKQYKSKTGAIRVKAPVRLFVETDAAVCNFVLKEDGSPCRTVCPMTVTEGGFFYEFVPQKTGLYFYGFEADGVFFGLNENNYGAAENCPEFHLTVTEKGYQTPSKFKGGIIYQIFPDRFAKQGETPTEKDKILRTDWGGTPTYLPVNGIVKNNDFFGGNARGIIQKLDYLTALGITALYLNPVFKAASNHRYDTGDYEKIDPTFATEEEFKTLLSECKKRNISVVLDGVFNHTGDDSKYFNKYGKYEGLGAYQSKNSPYYGWYDFTNYPDEYAAWWGIKILPAVNDNNPSFIEYITGENGILAKWQKLGVDGWRLDVADELSDAFIERIRSRVKKQDENALLIGEVWEEADDKIAYSERRRYLQGKELDGVMNYPLKNAILTAAAQGDFTQVFKVVSRLVDRYPACSLNVLWNSLSTHDTYRVLTSLSGVQVQEKSARANYKMDAKTRKLATEREKIAALLQFTLPGIPCIYYGDEIGMEGYEDPFNRRCFPHNGWDEDLLAFYRKLAKIRKSCTAFAEGEYSTLLIEKGTYVFERKTSGGRAVVAINVEGNEYTLQFSNPVKEAFTQKVDTRFSLSRGTLAVFLCDDEYAKSEEESLTAGINEDRTPRGADLIENNCVKGGATYE